MGSDYYGWSKEGLHDEVVRGQDVAIEMGAWDSTFEDISASERKAATKAFLEWHMRTVLDPVVVVVQGSAVTAGQDETAVAVEDDTAVASMGQLIASN